MKKRLIGTLLLGALFVSSTSMFVSCKDYDDDINNVSDRVTVLEAAKVDLENKIAALRADLEANYATKVALANAVSDLNDAISAETNRAKQAEADEYARATAAEAALSTRIQTAQDAIDDLNTLIGGDISKSANFADCKTYKEALEKTWAKIESVETGLGNRLTALETDLNLDNPQSKIRVYLATLENQIAALQSWQAGLDADGGAATKNYVGTKIAEAEGRAAVDAATKAAEALAAAKGYTDEELAKAVAQALKDAAADAQKKADKALADAKTYADGKANEALIAAKEYAAAEAKAKADAAEAAAKAYAKEYADQMLDEAKTYANRTATAKANAALAAAKEYADELLVKAKEYTDQEVAKAKEYAEQKATAAQTAAQNYADGKVAAAITECKGYAEDMRDAAINAAKTYTDTEITNLKNNELKALSDRIDVIESDLNILQMISKQLRSIVFIPQGYIDGVEGMKVLYLYYWKFNNHYLANGTKDVKENWTVLGGANAGWNTKEAKYTETVDITEVGKDREQDHDRYYSQNYAVQNRLLDFTAKYHMNPSSADASLIKSVGTVNADKWFEKTRTATNADCGFYVKGWSAANGILNVEYAMTDRTKVKTGDEITVFATTVQYGDTTITSDYATLMNIYVDSLVLSHAPATVAPSLRVKGTAARTKDTKALVKNSHCGYCALADASNGLGRDSLHLFATITEAAGTTVDEGKAIKTDDKFAPQDSVAYNDRNGINLNQLVETHYTDKTDHKHKHLTDISTYGLKYKFELTKLVYGTNLTSESAHAVIVFKKDGKVVEEGTEGATPYLIPWMPTDESRQGVQQAYDATRAASCQTKQLVGRTPLVRVSLVDENNNVLDYGYIRFLIVDNDVEPTDPENPYRRFISFDGPDWSASKPWCGVWTNGGYEYDTKWIETELKLYALDGTMSHNTFINNYYIEFLDGKTAPIGGSGALKQYNVVGYSADAENMAKFSGTSVYSRGQFLEIPNPKDGESNTLKWTMTAAQAKSAWVDGYATAATTDSKLPSDAVAVRYIYDPNKDGISDNEMKDIYVIFKTGSLTYTEGKEVKGTVNWTNPDRKNPHYWYKTNTFEAGYDEVHANVYGVEDAKEDKAFTLAQTIQAAFLGNKIVDGATDKDAFITVVNKDDNTPSTIITGKDLTLTLQFTEGTYKNFQGYYDNKKENIITYVANKKNGGDGRALMAWVDLDKDGTMDTGEPRDTVATLEYTDNGSQDINHMDVKYHKTAIAKALLNWRAHNDLQNDVLTAYVTIKAKYGTCPVDLTVDPIRVRFLRPINVTSKNAEVEDAAVSEKQVVDLLDLVNFTDWREQAFKTNYWFYYDVKKIEIPGVSNNQLISNNPNVMTNLGIAAGEEIVTPALTNKLQAVSGLVEFKFFGGAVVTNTADAAPAAKAYGYLEYTNLGSNVQEFDVKIPLKITYIWGELFTEATIKVHNTHANARLSK